MADGIVKLPDDSSNTGPKVRTETRTVGSNTVHEHYMIVTGKSADLQAEVLNSAPTTEAGVVVRNIPSGTQTTKETRPSSGAVTSVAGPASSVTLLSSNADRLSFSVYNDSTSAVYVKFGTTASTSSFTVKIQSQGYYESPCPSYTGRVDAIWDSATGNARITENT